MIRDIALLSILSPFFGGVIAGIVGKIIGDRASQWITILCVLVAFIASVYVFTELTMRGTSHFYGAIYTWGESGKFEFDMGIMIDRLSAIMMVVVTFVSLLVHIYSIGYMNGEPGYSRFFSYMSLFTFFMLVLVAANNFFLLFLGWEGVGLISYLLIGFWYQRESAAQGSLKAFVVNRVGDFGFIIGIAAVIGYFGSVDYATIFEMAPAFSNTTMTIMPGVECSVMTFICVFLFIGAMGKSAQLPLHVWLPESMEGPTPISALIHAATMVTAGIYMVARLSPMFELSQVALSMVLVIGATGALFLGILGLVQHDIKRVIAYSTMSQLGYMMAANGVSAFSASIFHLITHASFKALLFLAAGSVIVALHHEQDMRKMGGLRKYLPITYMTFLIGALALAAIPPFSGFYSKDSILEAVQQSHIPGAGYAYVCLLIGAFVTALYIFRAFFMTFHGTERLEPKWKDHIQESPMVIIMPLVLLAIPSMLLGILLIRPMIYHPFPLLGHSIYVLPEYNYLFKSVGHYEGALYYALNSFKHLPLWFAISGIFVAWISYVKLPGLPRIMAKRLHWLYQILINKYGFDIFNHWFFVRGGKKLSQFFYTVTDTQLIDQLLVNGSGREISRFSVWIRKLQSGYLYHYAFVMVLGLFIFLIWTIEF